MKTVIMCGGGGTRLWPMSQEDYPKQFLKLFGKKTLLQETYARARKIVSSKDILIASNQKFVKLIRKQLPQISAKNIIAEPVKRDNAAAVCLSLLNIAYKLGSPDEVMVMLAADHVIQNVSEFTRIIKKGTIFIRKNPEYILSLGIKPTYPETGYGYIERSGTVLDKDIYEITRYTEKPDINNAKKFISNDNYYWNGGIFIWHVGNMLKLYKKFLPMIYGQLKITLGRNYKKVLRQIYPTLEATSIDFGIIEKAPHLAMLPTHNLGWSDVGNWQTVYDLKKKGKEGNVCEGKVVNFESTNNLILAGGKKIVTLGVKDLVIVEHNDTLLICEMKRSGEIKKLLEKIKNVEC